MWPLKKRRQATRQILTVAAVVALLQAQGCDDEAMNVASLAAGGTSDAHGESTGDAGIVRTDPLRARPVGLVHADHEHGDRHAHAVC